jgi:hypothetical protein
MKAVNHLGGAVLLVSLSGCFSYVPAELGTLPSGQEVRVVLNRDATERLLELGVSGVADVRDPVVAGVLVRGADGRLSLRVPIRTPAGGGRSAIAQEVPFDAGELLRIDRRQHDGLRTGLAVAGTVGAAAAVIVLIIQGSEGEPRLPLPGGPDDSRIPR